MNYNEALNYIHGTYKFGSKLGLDNIRYLLYLLDNPHKDLKMIHIAGTNGKGSTSSFINSILIEEGYNVGLFTSPYLEEFTERIKINGENIPKEDLGKVTGRVKEKVEIMLEEGKNHPTEFEIVTAIAFEYFKLRNVDFVILEVGLGGRLDSTNVIENPLVSVITPIELDHTEYLGDTIDKIAFEKAGIIKKNSYVVSHPQYKEAENVIAKICNEKGSRLFIAPINSVNINRYDEFGISFDANILENKYKDLSIKLLGTHQVNNATVALTVIEVLRNYQSIEISDDAIITGLQKTNWPGRLEILTRNPTLLIDGAHNLHGAKALSKTIKEIFDYDRLIGVVGILGDKDVDGILSEVIPLCDKVIATRPNSPRALSLDELVNKIESFNKEVIGFEKIEDAVNYSLDKANENDLVLYCGSLYMIGEVRTLLKKMVAN